MSKILKTGTLILLISLMLISCGSPAVPQQPAAPQSPAVSLFEAPVAVQQVTTESPPPSGACPNEGDAQITSTSKSVCIAGVWISATATPDETTIVPIAAPTAPVIQLPAGAPTSFNGATLPTSATSSWSNDGVTFMMFGGASMTMVADYTFVAVSAEGVATIGAGITTVAACVTPVVILGVIVYAVYEFTQFAIITKPAYISHPEAIAAPVAPVPMVYTDVSQIVNDLVANAVVDQKEFKVGTSTLLVTTTITCYMNLHIQVYWYDMNNQMQSKEFEHENPACTKGKWDLYNGLSDLYKQIVAWKDELVASGQLTSDLAWQWIQPVIDGLFDLMLKTFALP